MSAGAEMPRTSMRGAANDAQTEARAIAQTSLWVPAKPEHAKIGWTYDFDQTERISNAAYESTGYDATMEVVEFVMAEADRRHATALAAKDAELSKVRDAEAEKWFAQMGQTLARAERAEALSRTGAVKVKALTWSDHPAGGEQALGAGLGLYRVHANGDDWYLVPDHMGIGGKAAAQADYECRIRSALVEVAE